MKSYAAAARAEMVRAAPPVVVSLADKPYGLSLSVISVPKNFRRQGHATAALKALTAHADSLGIILSLTPDSCFGQTPLAALLTLYQAHGFTRNRDPQILDTYVRHPVG